ncbi:MAG TPA: HEAT repeat domain-containing protein [Chondromyces sp.]|nr:HEAT repeat domain-containing protein [Chondromyces sp.]
MNVILYIIAVICLCMLVVLMTMYIALYRAKVKNQKKKRQKQEWIRQHKALIDNLLETGEIHQDIIPKTVFDFEVLEEELVRRIKKDDTLLKWIHSFIRMYFLDHYRKRLRHSKPSVRVNSLFYIEYFQLVELQEEVLSLLKKKQLLKQEKYQIYMTLASFSYRGMLDILLSGKENLPVFVRRRILETVLNESTIPLVIGEFHRYPLAIRESILDVLREKHVRSAEFLSLLEELLQDSAIMSESHHMELRVRIWKALAAFGYFPNIDFILHAIPNAKREPERIMLARVMGSIRQEEFIPFLEEMLADSSYLVRNEAAHSISKYRNGINHLRRVVTFHPDRFARDIAAEWLERGLYDY